MRWSTFLRLHAQGIVACDFFIAVTATFRLLYVFVLIEHRSRRLIHCNVTAHPSAAWTLQQLREAIGFQDQYEYLIHDRDPMFTQQFVAILRASGVATVNARRALLEVKKLHNGKFWDGLEAQLPSYSKSDGSKNRPDARCGERKLSCLFRRGAAY